MIRWADLKELESEHLILRKIRLDDVEDYYRNVGSREAVTRYMLFDAYRDISESRASIEKVLRRYSEGRCYRWAITRKGEDRLVGIVELLRFDETDNSCSFAYMLSDDHWGKGYGTEVLNAVFAFAIREMGVEVIRADHMAANPASGRCMEKAGMVQIGMEEGKYVKNGISQDAVLYELRI